jgi:hypothetical protein
MGIGTILMKLLIKNHKLLTNLTALENNEHREVRLHNESDLSMGFTWTRDSSCRIPLCLVCGKRLTNAAMVPAKLKRRSATIYSHMTSKSDDYFKRLLESQNRQGKAFVS